MSLEIGATKKIFHQVLESELQRFCVEYRLETRVSYRRTLNGDEWGRPFLDTADIPEDEILLIHVLLRATMMEALNAR